VALRVTDALDVELEALHRHIRSFASRQPGCQALQAQYGVGSITSTAIWAMMGDTRRFCASRQAVRHAGLDVTVYSSDGKRSRGHLAKQGPPLLRWALYEAACLASHTRAPDHDYYAGVKDRFDHKRAAISVARKIARRSHPHPPRTRRPSLRGGLNRPGADAMDTPTTTDAPRPTPRRSPVATPRRGRP